MISERITHRELAKLYGTRVGNINRMAAAGQIPYHRIEGYVRNDGTPAQRYVFLRSIVMADLERTGQLAAERRSA